MQTHDMEQEPRKVSKPNENTRPPGAGYIDFDGDLHYSKKRLNDIRTLLRRYKAKETTEAENIILAHAMEDFKLSIDDEADERIFTTLLLSYFHEPALSALDVSKALKIHDRTVFKDITKGVERLCVLIFGISAFTVDNH